MAQIVIRKLDDAIKESLKQRARSHGRSMEEEARAILNAALSTTVKDPGEYGLGSRIAKRFKGHGLTAAEADSMELRGQPIRPADFD